MIDEKLIRTAMIIGEENINKLKRSKVMIFGVGGVGSFAAEALVRTGLGEIIIVDYDIISSSNINRQSHAFIDTVGKVKVNEMEKRLKRINPELKINSINLMVNKENLDEIVPENLDYIVDAIDMVSTKIAIIEYAKIKDIPIISAMGAGNKLNPQMLEVSDIYSTRVCPLARVMRRELRKRNIDKLKVVYSKEEPKKFYIEDIKEKNLPGSVAFVPSVSGLIIAAEVVKDLIRIEV